MIRAGLGHKVKIFPFDLAYFSGYLHLWYSSRLRGAVFILAERRTSVCLWLTILSSPSEYFKSLQQKQVADLLRVSSVSTH